MSDINFSCPSCTQHIACDDSYRGARVNCPTCGSGVVVPPMSGPPPRPAAAPPVIGTAGTASVTQPRFFWLFWGANGTVSLLLFILLFPFNFIFAAFLG